MHKSFFISLVVLITLNTSSIAVPATAKRDSSIAVPATAKRAEATAKRDAGEKKFDPAARAAVIAPFMDEQTIVVARVDVTRIDYAVGVLEALKIWSRPH